MQKNAIARSQNIKHPAVLGAAHMTSFGLTVTGLYNIFSHLEDIVLLYTTRLGCVSHLIGGGEGGFVLFSMGTTGRYQH